MSPFLGLTRTRSFSLLYPLFRIYTQDQPHRHVVAIRQLHNYVAIFRGSPSARPSRLRNILSIEPTEAS